MPIFSESQKQLYDSSREQKISEGAINGSETLTSHALRVEKTGLEITLAEKEEKLAGLQSKYFKLKSEREHLDADMTEAKHELAAAKHALEAVSLSLAKVDARGVQLGMAESNQKKKNIPEVYTTQEIINSLERTVAGHKSLAMAEKLDAFTRKIPLIGKFFNSAVSDLYRETVIGMAREERAQLSNNRLGRAQEEERKEHEVELVEQKVLGLRKLFMEIREEENDIYRNIEQQKLEVKNTEAALKKLRSEYSNQKNIEKN
ncbi:MAG: hypothetical protein KA052_01195 [Candidatus Pacebacteria bacterium]|nr:hypothetical protein [Candidatus Paceibacterota bacterium]